MCRYLLFSLPRSRRANRRGYWACAREGYKQLETPACPLPEDHHGPQEPLRSSEKPFQGGTCLTQGGKRVWTEAFHVQAEDAGLTGHALHQNSPAECRRPCGSQRSSLGSGEPTTEGQELKPPSTVGVLHTSARSTVR